MDTAKLKTERNIILKIITGEMIRGMGEVCAILAVMVTSPDGFRSNVLEKKFSH